MDHIDKLNNLLEKMKNKLEKIKEYLYKYEYGYVKIENENSINKIYNLLINNVKEEAENDIEYLYYGVYYKINKQYDMMKKYYLLGIENNNIDAMINLGNYYKNIEKNEELMTKYYLMSESYFYLAHYYKNTNLNLYEKYLIEGINKNKFDCYSEFTEYHIQNKNNNYLRTILEDSIKEKDNYYCYEFLADIYERLFSMYEESEKYFLKAIPYANKGNCYNRIGWLNVKIENYTKASFYLKKAIEEKCNNALINYGYLLEIFENYKGALYYYKKSIESNNNVGAYNLIIKLYYEKYKDYQNVLYYYQKAIDNNMKDKIKYNEIFINEIKEKLIFNKVQQLDYLLDN